MLARNLLGIGVTALFLSVAACGDAGDGAPEDLAATDAAITGSLSAGQQLKTTARVNLREGPSTGDDVIRTLPVGTVVTLIDASPSNGYYHIDSDGDEGWSFGAYLKATGASTGSGSSTSSSSGSTSDGTDNVNPGTPTGAGETCKASFYDEGQQTANGERFNPEALTAAHKTLRFNTKVRVTNPANGQSVVVRINDRGPFVAGRCLDLSRAAFRTIGSLGAGVMTVRYEVLQ